MKEIWKDVVGYEGLYSVSNSGKIRADFHLPEFKDKRILKPHIGLYARFALFKNKVKKEFLAHRIVAEAFIGKCPKGKEVNHKDGNKINNVPNNLEYVTSSQNKRHAHDNGFCNQKGEKNNFSKFTNKEIIEIRNKYKHKKCSYAELARKYCVSWSAIRNIILRINWKHI